MPQTTTSAPAIEPILALTPVIPVLTVERAGDALPLARALFAGGLPVLEVTLRTDAALEAIRIMSRLDGALVGAGTVLTPADLDAVGAAGAAFAISPGATDALLAAGRTSAIPLLPGVATASDIMRGLDFGYRCFKFCPAAAAGGPAALKAFAGPFGNVRFCPTGGINAANLGDYLGLPNVLCVGGSWMVSDTQDFAQVEQAARDAVTLARASLA
jgi:2-dehydro-3-deoxyphosphogluconate aldolase/(4S)-4-hydroxy-2-oxoglutarate aldolase